MNALATGTDGLVAGLGPEAAIDYDRRLRQVIAPDEAIVGRLLEETTPDTTPA